MTADPWLLETHPCLWCGRSHDELCEMPEGWDEPGWVGDEDLPESWAVA